MGGTFGDDLTRRVARTIRCPTEPESIGWQMNYPYALVWSGRFGEQKKYAPHCPLLYLYGTRKPFLFHSKEWAEELAQRPGCQVVPLHAAHWVMLDQPQQFNETVLNWLG